MDKVHDALNASDKSGVDVGMLQQASTALDHDQMDEALVLLERSIGTVDLVY